MKLLVLIALLSLVASQTHNNQCQYEEIRNCERKLNELMSWEKSDFENHNKRPYLCKNLREEFSCVQWESVWCKDQRDSGLLPRARQLMRNACDSLDKGQSDSRCFQRSEIRRCETQYQSDKAATYSQDPCRAYIAFRDCVQEKSHSICSYSDHSLVGVFIYDIDPDGWKCGQLSTSSSGRYQGSGGSYGTSDRGGTGGSGGSYPNYGGSSSYGAGGSSSSQTCCKNEQCNSYRQNQCRDALNLVINTRKDANYNPDHRNQCRDIRNNFNCVLWHAGNCGTSRGISSTQPQAISGEDGHLIRRARDWLTTSCDNSDGGWKSSQCFMSNEIQTCDRRLVDRGNYANTEACREFNEFKECVKRHVNSRCNQNDEDFLGSYFYDQGRDKAWMCSRSGSSSSIGGGSNYGGVAQAGFGQSNYGGQSSYGGSQDYRGGGSFDSNFEEADDRYCYNMVQAEANWCYDTFEMQRRESDEEMRKICCATMRFQDCVKNAIERKCSGRGSENVYYRLSERVKGDMLQYCRGISRDQCSSSITVISSWILMLGMILITRLS